MTTEIIEKSFDVTASARLYVNNVAGSVVVQSGEMGVIRVTVAKHTHSGDSNRTQVELSQAADGSVSATTRYECDNMLGWLFGSRPCEVDYVIKVPANCDVKIKGVSSSIMVSDLQGACDVCSVSGELTLIGVHGPICLDTVSGNIAGQQLAGTLKAKTVSGTICLRESDFPQADANTVSGEMVLETPLGSGPYQLHSVSGDVHLVVPSATGCVVDLHSISGQFGSDLPVNMVDRQMGSYHAEVQGGGTNIRMKSVSGGLWLETTDASTSAVASTPAPSRRDLLERLEKGELTVDETLSALRE